MQLHLAKPYESFRGEIQSLLNSFSQNGEVIHDARNQLKVFKWSQGELVIKAFKIPHTLNRFVYKFLRGSKAKKSFDNSVELISRGIGVPAPMGYMVESAGVFIRRSYFISEKFDYDLTFHDTNLKRVALDPALLESFASFVYSMHSKGVLHLDLTPGNILIKKNKDGFAFGLVDVNRMKFGSVGLQQGCDNLGRLFFEENLISQLSKFYAKKRGCEYEVVFKMIKRSHDSFLRNKNIKNKLRGRAN